MQDDKPIRTIALRSSTNIQAFTPQPEDVQTIVLLRGTVLGSRALLQHSESVLDGRNWIRVCQLKLFIIAVDRLQEAIAGSRTNSGNS